MAVSQSPLEGHILVPMAEYTRLRAAEAQQRVHSITRGVTRFAWIAVGAVLTLGALAMWSFAAPEQPYYIPAHSNAA